MNELEKMAKYAKKRQKGWGWFVHPTNNIKKDAGIVPLNNCIFNQSMGAGDTQVNGGEGGGEAVTENRMRNKNNNTAVRLTEDTDDFYITTVEYMISGFIDNMSETRLDKELTFLDFIVKKLRSTEQDTFVMQTDRNQYNPNGYADKGNVKVQNERYGRDKQLAFVSFYPDEDSEV